MIWEIGDKEFKNKGIIPDMHSRSIYSCSWSKIPVQTQPSSPVFTELIATVKITPNNILHREELTIRQWCMKSTKTLWPTSKRASLSSTLWLKRYFSNTNNNNCDRQWLTAMMSIVSNSIQSTHRFWHRAQTMGWSRFGRSSSKDMLIKHHQKLPQQWKLTLNSNNEHY